MRNHHVALVITLTVGLSCVAHAQDRPPLGEDGTNDTPDQVADSAKDGPPPPRIIGRERHVQGKRPLDLPTGGKKRDDEETEDVLEVVSFYGTEIEGDAFFFLRASVGAGEEYYQTETINALLKDAIGQLSRLSEFSVVSFNDRESHVWSDKPRRASPGNKQQAIEWLEALQDEILDNWFCIRDAALTTLEIAKKSRKSHVSLLFMGNYWPNSCGELIDDIDEFVDDLVIEITEANTKRFPINTVYFCTCSWSLEFEVVRARGFWQGIADMNQGHYTEVED